MSAMVAAEQLVNEGAVHTLSRLLLASTDGAVDDEDAVHLETEERGF